MRYTLTTILILCLVASTGAFAQRKEIRKARASFDEGDYYHCREYLNQAVELGGVLGIEERKMKARALYELNSVMESYLEYLEIESELTGEDIYYYAKALHRFGLYEEAIEWYDKAKKSGAAPVSPMYINDFIEACRWAMNNPQFLPDVRANLNRELLANGQSFGIQVYEDNLVFSYAAQDSKNLDKNGNAFLNLYQVGYENGKVIDGEHPKPFSHNLLSPYHVGAISFTSDKKHLFYTKTVYVNKESMLKIYVADFDGTEWVNERLIEFDSDEFDLAHPYVSPDDKYLYFVSNMPDHTKIYGKSVKNYGGKDIFRAQISGDINHFTKVENLGPEVNSYGDELYPVLNVDGKLYFSSDTWKGYGGLDIFCAEYIDGKWQNVRNMLKPYNSNNDDFYYLKLEPDAVTGFLSSNRHGDQNVDGIFDVVYVEPETDSKADLMPPIFGMENVNIAETKAPLSEINDQPIMKAVSMAFTTKVYSTYNNELIEGAAVRFLDEETETEITFGETDATGTVVLDVNPDAIEGKEIIIAASKAGYNDKTLQVTEEELANISKEGIKLTPIFNDEVLDEISGMVIAYDNDLDAEALKTLDKLASYLVKSPGVTVKLNAHTEAKGNKYTNLDLSQRMADKAKDYLVSRGVKASQLIPRGYGERYLKNRCFRGRYCDASKHKENRRIEVVVWNSKK